MTTGIIRKENNRASMPSTSFSGLVDQFFHNNLNRFFEDELWGFNGVGQTGNVPVNVRETDKTYEMELVAPGLKKEAFNLEVNGDLLTVSFEHKQENQEQQGKDNWLRKEYRMQSFSRSFTLDDSIDANKINASYTDGILKVTLPKKEGTQRISKNIEIK